MTLFLLGLSMVFVALLWLHQSLFETKRINYIMNRESLSYLLLSYVSIAGYVGYVEYLSIKNKTKMNHRSSTPVREIGNNSQLLFLPKSDCSIPEQRQLMDAWTRENPDYTYLCLMSYTPNDSIKKHCFIATLESVSCILFVCSPGSDVGNMFLWKTTDKKDVNECFERSQAVVESVKPCLPVYHT